MTVSVDVINDLLPLYLAGEASEGTRALMDAYLKEHPGFAQEVSARAAETVALLGGVAPTLADVHEKTTLERVRRFNRRRVRLLGLCIACTLMPLSFHFDSGGMTWVMLRDSPNQVAFFWIAATACWTWYYLMGRRL